jgi:hypothetical protein
MTSRLSSRRRGYDSKWEEASAAFLRQPGHGHCSCGCGRHADMVDHRVAHKGDPVLFWSRSNWQPMNRRCNSRKAASREGGFGNPVRQAGTEIAAGVTLGHFDPADARGRDRQGPSGRRRGAQNFAESGPAAAHPETECRKGQRTATSREVSHAKR